MTRVRAFVLAMMLGLGGALRGEAQVSSQHGLTFGTVMAGTATSIPYTSPNAAQFKIHGILIVTSQITLTLPPTIKKADGTTMAVTYCSTCAAYKVNSLLTVGATTFNPATGFSGLVVSVLSDIYVWVGGSINPPKTQSSGSYSGTMTLTVSSLF